MTQKEQIETAFVMHEGRKLDCYTLGEAHELLSKMHLDLRTLLSNHQIENFKHGDEHLIPKRAVDPLIGK